MKKKKWKDSERSREKERRMSVVMRRVYRSWGKLGGKARDSWVGVEWSEGVEGPGE
jgi:hypothetical protein